MRRLCILLAVGLVLGAAASAPAGVAVKKPTKLQQLARSLVKAGAPGAIAFVRTPKATRSGVAGYASRTPRYPMRAIYRYRIGSVTKTFVSTIVLELAAEGKLTLDDRVERWLPGKVSNGGAISLRQLLNHTSGLYDFTKDEHFVESVIANPSRVWTPQQLLDVAFSHAPNFEPGTDWSYSNTGYILLGLVTEAVTRKPFQDVLFERLVGPLNLHSTSLPTSPVEPEPWVHGFVDLGQGDSDISSLLSPTEGWTAGGIVSNASDVTRFLSALLRGRLLPPLFLAQMKSASAVSGSYGLGLVETSTRCGLAYGHDGDFVGWRNVSLSTASGKRQAVVVVNTGSRVSNLMLQAAAKTALCSG